MTTDELEPIDPELAQLLEPARTIEPVDARRRARLKVRLAAELGNPEATSTRRRRWVIALSLAAAAIAMLWIGNRSLGTTGAGRAQSVADRRTVRTGDRSIAVLEPGSDIAWAIDEGGANVDQSRGRVFYRVEPGSPYVVRTPAADVRVTGTSFEVEIIMNTQKQRLRSMSLGAALASVTVVTVYEGRVVLANEHGSTEIEAGHTAHADADHPPSATRSRIPVVAAAAGSRARDPNAAVPGTEHALVSDLRARVRELEAELETARTTSSDDDSDDTQERIEFAQRVYDPTPEQLQEAAENCKLSFAVPATLESGEYITDASAERLGLTAAERQAITKALEDANTRWEEQLRAIYVDATGDDVGAGALSFEAMRAEILDKAVLDDLIESRKRVAKERAGLLAPPAPGEGSPAERYYRHELERTVETYSLMSDAVGDDRAYEVLGSLPTNMSNYSDCRDE